MAAIHESLSENIKKKSCGRKQINPLKTSLNDTLPALAATFAVVSRSSLVCTDK
jgi:hypothetical protein